MRIGIDCRLAGTAHGGIGRYIQNLLRYAVKNDIHTWVLFFYDKKQAKNVLGEQLRAENITLVYTPVRHYTISEQLRMPIYFYRAKLDLLHVPHFNVPLLYRKPFVVTIHDLLWHHHRGSEVTTLSKVQYWGKYLFYRLIVRQAVLRAKQVIVPAKTVKETLVGYYYNVKDNITVTYEGVDTTLLEKQPHQHSAPKTLLYVGSLYPHKNVRLVISALQRLSAYTLEIIGSRSVFTKQTEAFIQSLGLEDQVKMIGYLPDDALREKYQHVSALVQPSLSEGFGLTGIEAMALGTPVLASDIPIFKEIYANGALYFDPHSVNSFIATVRKLETIDQRTLQKKAKQTASQYSWEKMVEKTISIYEST